MFVNAIEIASNYTHPVIISVRHLDGTTESQGATFIMVNRDGWALTSGHVMGILPRAQQHAEALQKYQQQVQEIESNAKLSPRAKQTQIGQIKHNPKLITQLSYWWGQDGFQYEICHINSFNDLALIKIKNYNPEFCRVYPVFKNPASGMKVGTSLCKLGYPLWEIKTSWDEETKRWVIGEGVLPMPRFPLEGMHTRVKIIKDAASGKQAKYIETSSPGLRGQSGGPIFDTEGHVWALQSHTAHFNLGFNPKVKRGEREVEENQFLNVGLGSHVEDILKFMDNYQVEYQISS